MINIKKISALAIIAVTFISSTADAYIIGRPTSSGKVTTCGWVVVAATYGHVGYGYKCTSR